MSKVDHAVVPGGELERALLAALWARQEATARQLYEDIDGPGRIVYTTVAKVLDRLAEKGIVSRRRSGQAYSYRATVPQEATQRAMARSLIAQLAGAGPRPAIAALVGAIEEVSPELLDQLAAEIQTRRRGRDGT